MSDISSMLYDEDEEFSGGCHMIPEGYDTLMHYIAEDQGEALDIHLDTEVTEITYQVRIVVLW